MAPGPIFAVIALIVIIVLIVVGQLAFMPMGLVLLLLALAILVGGVTGWPRGKQG